MGQHYVTVMYETEGGSLETDSLPAGTNPYNLDVELPLFLREKYGMREKPRVKLMSAYDSQSKSLIEFKVDEGGQWIGGEGG